MGELRIKSQVSGRKISIFLQRKEMEEEMLAPAFSREYDVSDLAMAGWCTRHTWWTRVGRQTGGDVEEYEGWEVESARGTRDARSHVETILVREFTSIFISTRHQLFTRPESLAIWRIRRPNARQRVIKRDDRDTRYGRGYGRRREKGTGKGLCTCGKRPVVSGSLKSDYDVR